MVHPIPMVDSIPMVHPNPMVDPNTMSAIPIVHGTIAFDAVYRGCFLLFVREGQRRGRRRVAATRIEYKGQAQAGERSIRSDRRRREDRKR